MYIVESGNLDASNTNTDGETRSGSSFGRYVKIATGGCMWGLRDTAHTGDKTGQLKQSMCLSKLVRVRCMSVMGMGMLQGIRRQRYK